MVASEELRFRAGDLTLAGTLTIPDAEGRRPWVLMVPSWLPRDRDGDWDREQHAEWFAPMPADAPPGLLARLAVALARRGVASLRYDPRGCGASAGTWETSSLFMRIDDARDALGAMRSRRELDLRRTGIVGHGEGAGIALSVAIGDPAVGLVGLIGGSARSFRDVLRRGAAARGRTLVDRRNAVVAAVDRAAEELIEGVARREPSTMLDVGGRQIALDLTGWEQAFHTPPLALATMLHREVVLAHGTADAWSHPDESRILRDVLAGGGNEPVLQLISGAGHELSEADDGAIDAFAAALASRLRPRELPPVLVAIEEMTS